MFPAPVAPEQGTALSTTATEKIRPDKKLSGYSQPDYSSSDYHHIERADIGYDSDKVTGSGRVVILAVLDTNLDPRKKLFLVPNSLFEDETTPFLGEMGFGFGFGK